MQRGRNQIRTSGADLMNSTLRTVLLVLLILLLLGLLPVWPYSNGWGMYPGGGVGLILLIVIILLATGKL
jgi:low affinity Fe/Cu permease